jgi:hypothetical protein
MDTHFEGIRFDGNYSVLAAQPGQSVRRGLSCAFGHLCCGRRSHPYARHHRATSGIAGEDEFPLPTGSTTDGRSFDGTVTIGAGFDDGRGHAVAYFGYRDVHPVLQANRDYSACVMQNTGTGIPRCGGSATANPGTAVLFPGGGGSSLFALGPANDHSGSEPLQLRSLNYYQRPDERYIAGAFADYEISSALKPYLEFMFMDDRTLAQIAPSGDFGNTFTINCDNPFMSAQQAATICGDPDNLIVGFLGNFPVPDSASFNDGTNGTPGPFTADRFLRRSRQHL